MYSVGHFKVNGQVYILASGGYKGKGVDFFKLSDFDPRRSRSKSTILFLSNFLKMNVPFLKKEPLKNVQFEGFEGENDMFKIVQNTIFVAG